MGQYHAVTKEMQGKKTIFAYLGLDWCGHCIKFYPQWIDFATTRKYDDITFVTVDLTRGSKIGKELNIHSVPTIMVYESYPDKIMGSLHGGSAGQLEADCDELCQNAKVEEHTSRLSQMLEEM